MSDPPRVTGAYGIPAYDPDFGFALRGSAFDHQLPIPPPPPQPAASAGVKDPYVQLLESQSAMSMLMMQMAREMNQRSSQQLQQQQQQPVMQDPSQQPAAGQQQVGQAGPPAREMRMDEMDTGYAGATMEAMDFKRKRTFRVQGLDRRILRLVMFNPRCLQTRVG